MRGKKGVVYISGSHEKVGACNKERIKKGYTSSKADRDILKWKLCSDGVKDDLEVKYHEASGNRKI